MEVHAPLLLAKGLKYSDAVLSQTTTSYLLSQKKDATSGWQAKEVKKGWPVEKTDPFSVNTEDVGIDAWLKGKGVKKEEDRWVF